MSVPETLKFYAAALGYPKSDVLGEILSTLFNSKLKQDLAACLPATIEELSVKTGYEINKIREAIQELRLVGAICRNHRDPTIEVFQLYPNMIEIRDAVMLTKGIDRRMVELWDHMVREEMPGTIPLMKKLEIPPTMRTIPIEETVESDSTVLDIESARALINKAEQIVAVSCACRSSRHRLDKSPDCPAPPEPDLCLAINRFGLEALERGVGTAISKEEAINRLKIAEDAGLVHMTRNNVKDDFSICNCCSCCCTGTLLKNKYNFDAFTPSRFRVDLDEDECTGCEECVDRCQFHAIQVDDIANIDLDRCFGCGNCVQACPTEALCLKEVEPEDSIRRT